MFQDIITAIDDGVGIVTLNRPERGNAFDDQMIAELSSALVRMSGDPSVRVIVISGVGDSFCLGAGVDWMRRVAAYSIEENRRDASELSTLLKRISECPKPVIARIQGEARNGGVGLIAACDMAVTLSTARFNLAEVRHGMIPAIIAPWVLAAIGDRAARRHMLTAEPFDAAEALSIGLVQAVAANEDELDDKVGEWVDAIMRNGPRALAECKSLLRSICGRPIGAKVIDYTVEYIARVRVSPEGQEGLAAAIAGRRPKWLASGK